MASAPLDYVELRDGECRFTRSKASQIGTSGRHWPVSESDEELQGTRASKPCAPSRVRRMVDQVLSADEWYRVGQGRRRELPGLSPRDLPALFASLPSDLGPYALVAGARPGERGPRHCRRIQLSAVEEEILAGVWQYFIVGEGLAAGFVHEFLESSTQTLAVNGAVNLQIGRPDGRGGVAVASAGLVDRVAQRDGSVIEHSGSRMVFDAVVRFDRARSDEPRA
jgi:hypothetical protein